MTSGLENSNLYLASSRTFPAKVDALAIEINKVYVDIANVVNAKTIGTFGTTQLVTGERWSIGGPVKQTLRRVYSVTGTGNIAHGINTSQIGGFTAIYGQFTDGTIWYTLPYVNVVNVTNQISLTITSTNIVITAGAGAPPAVSSGFVVLEWLATS